ncbi:MULTISPECIES: acyl-CoA carboxylase subunit epsilon [unclassified Streptomyces]|uniref:acyl-CoA carboxylase subunit epsilon n=1 Tax=unclassified Streptomyces TaxID=2593676 RepID=UPI00380C9EF3
MESAPFARPALRVLRGEPTGEELAALTVVMLSRAGSPPAEAAAPAPAPGRWRPAVHHPAGAWRTVPR